MSHSDNAFAFTDPATDWLDRRPTVAALKRLLESPALTTPLVIGIYGGWGIGKTSVMRTLAHELQNSERVMLWFDAWVYARQEEALWRALLLRVVEALRAKLEGLGFNEQERKAAEAELDEARASLYRSLTLKEQGGIKVNWLGALPLAADAALSALSAGLSTQVAKELSGGDSAGGLTSALVKWVKGEDTKEAVKLIEREASERYVEQVSSLEQFQATFRKLLKRFKIGDKPDERRLFVYIDDLDRCLPEDGVAALEAIKLFLDLEGCVFVLGMDHEVVEQGIKARYKDLEPTAAFNPRQYLDKIIQIPFTLPPLGHGQIAHYLGQLSRQPGHHAALLCQDLIKAAAPSNPRALKRVLNILQLTLYLDGMSEAEIDALGPGEPRLERIGHIAKIVLMQVVFDRAYRALVQNPVLIKEAENFADHRENKLDIAQKPTFDLPGLQALLKLPPRFNSLPNDDIRQLFTLSKITSNN